MTSEFARPLSAHYRIFVCGESGCVRDAAELERLCGTLGRAGTVGVVGCQHVCGGPLIGLRVGGRLQWLGPVVTDDALSDVVTVACRRGRPPLPDSLAPLRRVKPRRPTAPAARAQVAGGCGEPGNFSRSVDD